MNNSSSTLVCLTDMTNFSPLHIVNTYLGTTVQTFLYLCLHLCSTFKMQNFKESVEMCGEFINLL